MCLMSRSRGSGFQKAVPTKNSENVEKSGYSFSSVVVSPACNHSSRKSSHGSSVGFAAGVELELEVIALRHQLVVLRRQRPGRTQLFSIDRLIWVWLYRLWLGFLKVIVVVKPATVIQWHRQGFGSTGAGGQSRDGPRSIARFVI